MGVFFYWERGEFFTLENWADRILNTFDLKKNVTNFCTQPETVFTVQPKRGSTPKTNIEIHRPVGGGDRWNEKFSVRSGNNRIARSAYECFRSRSST